MPWSTPAASRNRLVRPAPVQLGMAGKEVPADVNIGGRCRRPPHPSSPGLYRPRRLSGRGPLPVADAWPPAYRPVRHDQRFRGLVQEGIDSLSGYGRVTYSTSARRAPGLADLRPLCWRAATPALTDFIIRPARPSCSLPGPSHHQAGDRREHHADAALPSPHGAFGRHPLHAEDDKKPSTPCRLLSFLPSNNPETRPAFPDESRP
jgi:hypothetical protein